MWLNTNLYFSLLDQHCMANGQLGVKGQASSTGSYTYQYEISVVAGCK